MARQVADAMREHALERSSVSLVLVGHGTRRHPESRDSTLHLADALRRRRVAGEVLAAFIDDDPPLERLLAIATLPYLLVVPFLIGGVHAAEDIPRVLGWGATWRLPTDDRSSSPNQSAPLPESSTSSSIWRGGTFRPRRRASVPGSSPPPEPSPAQ